MRRFIPSTVLTLVATAPVVVLLGAQGPAAPAQRQIVFAKDVQPILDKNCLSCHGESMQLSKLDLRSRESAMQGGAHAALHVSRFSNHRLRRLMGRAAAF